MSKQSLPLRHCTVVSKEGESFRPFVQCPYRDGSLDAFECSDCARMTSFEWDAARGGQVVCEIEEEVLEKNKRPPTDRRADIGEAAARSSVKEVMRPISISVTADITVGRLKEMFSKSGVRTLPVVDDAGKLQSLVSKGDLIFAGNSAIVADVMPEYPHSLAENTPLSYAIALMAFEDLTEIPIVAVDGMVVGICHSVDALRWVARRMGYVPATEELSKQESEPSQANGASKHPPAFEAGDHTG